MQYKSEMWWEEGKATRVVFEPWAEGFGGD